MSYVPLPKFDRPWEGEDEPSVVLDRLATEAARWLNLPADVAARLRERVGENPMLVLRSAEAERDDYVAARQDYRDALASAWIQTVPRRISQAVTLIGAVFVAAGPFLFVWRIAAALGLGAWWSVLLLASPVALWVAWHKSRKSTTLFRRVMTVVVVTWLGGYLLQGAEWFGPRAGVEVALLTFLLSGAAATATYWAMEFFDDARPERKAQSAFDHWVERLYEQGVLPVAIEVANSTGTVFGTRLVRPARSYVDFDTVVDIDTPATTELRRLLKRGHGSFALAGPRGSGKTTLLERWCADYYSPTSSHAVVSLRVNAPVGYDPKEFLIHLFGRLCDEVQRLPERPQRVQGDVELADSAMDKRAKLRYLHSRTTENELGLDVTWGGRRSPPSGRLRSSVMPFR